MNDLTDALLRDLVPPAQRMIRRWRRRFPWIREHDIEDIEAAGWLAAVHALSMPRADPFTFGLAAMKRGQWDWYRSHVWVSIRTRNGKEGHRRPVPADPMAMDAINERQEMPPMLMERPYRIARIRLLRHRHGQERELWRTAFAMVTGYDHGALDRAAERLKINKATLWSRLYKPRLECTHILMREIDR